MFILALAGFFLSACQQHGDDLIEQLKVKRNLDTCDGPRLVRADIARKLGERGDPAAIKPLIEVLYSEDQSELSWGAVGCRPGSKATYPTAIDALAKFGPQAAAAIPRLLELLQTPEYLQLTPQILAAVPKIAPQSAPSLLVPIFLSKKTHDHYLVHYLRTLAEFKEQLQPYAKLLTDALLALKPQQLGEREKSLVLTILLYSGLRPEAHATVKDLLRDPEPLSWANTAAFAHAGENILPEILNLLDRFDAVFPEERIQNLRVWCGPNNLEGIRNALRGKLLSILIAICSEESMAALVDYKSKHSISIVCEGSSSLCRKRLAKAKE